jgi:ABC-2 type transport system permease protein
MKKLWLAAWHEYTKNIRQKSFLFALFSLPLFIGLSVGLGVIFSSFEENSTPVGYVDNSSLFDNPVSISEVSDRDRVEFVKFAELPEAQEALENGEIQAIFSIPSEYPENKNIEKYFWDDPSENAQRDFYDFLQLNLANDHRPEVRNRTAFGTNLIIRTPDGQREFPQNNPSVNIFLPLIVGVAFIMLLLISSGYLMGGFMEEKSNRTIEIMVTSLSPAQLIGSKLLTMLAIGFTMLFTWIIFGALVYIVTESFLDLTWFQDLTLNWRDILTVVAVALPSYVFAAALLLAIGLILGDKQEAESVGPIFFMLGFIPLWFVVAISSDVNGALAVAFSVLPMTSILTIGFRSLFIQIPIWQVIVSVIIQTLCAVGAVWLAIRTFRLGMLQYGKRLRLNEIISSTKRMIGES